MITSQLVYILFITNAVFFCLGYIVAKISTPKTVHSINDMVSVTSKKEIRNKSNIEIDDTKYVSKIKTDGLEKKYEKLGDKQTVENDTISSVNKLKNLKR